MLKSCFGPCWMNATKLLGIPSIIVMANCRQIFPDSRLQKYKNDVGYYLFYCDPLWQVQNDTYHDSIDDAIKQAEFEFAGTAKTWNKIPPS